MNKTSHTPGPWNADQIDANGQALICNDFLEIATCWHHCVGSIETQMQANARLIAAAPEMLEALKYVMTAHGEQLHDAFGMARYVIKKAEGWS